MEKAELLADSTIVEFGTAVATHDYMIPFHRLITGRH